MVIIITIIITLLIHLLALGLICVSILANKPRLKEIECNASLKKGIFIRSSFYKSKNGA